MTRLSGKLAFTCITLGLQRLKNIAKAVEVFAIDYMDKTDDAPTPDDANVTQTIKYCRVLMECALPTRFQAVGRCW